MKTKKSGREQTLREIREIINFAASDPSNDKSNFAVQRIKAIFERKENDDL